MRWKFEEGEPVAVVLWYTEPQVYQIGSFIVKKNWLYSYVYLDGIEYKVRNKHIYPLEYMEKQT